MVSGDFGQGLGCIFAILVVGFIAFIGLGSYFAYDKTGKQTFESRVKIEPTYKLETDGKKIDTVYVYTFND